MEKTLSVSAICNGTVIDRIPAGQAIHIIQLFQLTEHKHRVTVGLNLNSPSMGLKDIIKIEGKHFSEQEAHSIAIFAPNAVINFIEDYKVLRKITPMLPDKLVGIMQCPNSNCITHSEAMQTSYSVLEDRGQTKLCCDYCEIEFYKGAQR